MKFLLLFLSSGVACAASIQLSDTSGGVIPDGSISGLARSLVLDRPGEEIVSMTVELTVSNTAGGSAFLGDLYFYLTDGTNLVTLLNRPGRSAANPDGYNDDQSFSVTFDDAAVFDFHTYRLAVSGDENSPLLSTLGGFFQPDGRTESPLTVETSDPRTTQLSDFFGPGGERTFILFAADLSTGGTHQLDNWTLNIETIPEPGTGLLLALSLTSLVARRRRG